MDKVFISAEKKYYNNKKIKAKSIDIIKLCTINVDRGDLIVSFFILLAGKNLGKYGSIWNIK